MKEIENLLNVKIVYGKYPQCIKSEGNHWIVKTQNDVYETEFILNATYASVNDVLKITDGGLRPFKIKYEKCEIILCTVNDLLKHVGITVMDGPFFSKMPFGKTGLHSLTSVSFTPHETSYAENTMFACQCNMSLDFEKKCITGFWGNCDKCAEKPETAWIYMVSRK